MLQLFLEDAALLPVVGLVFFMTIFVLAVIRTMSRRRDALYERMAALPLEEDPE